VQAVTQICQNMINFALLLRVRDVVEVHNLPQANTAISLVILAFSLPAVVFGPLAGVIADRSNKRLLMALLNVARAVSILLFLVIRPGWHVETILAAYYIVTFLFGIAGQFFAPVLGATIPLVAPRAQLMSANALFNLTSTAAQLIGFAAAGPLLVKAVGIDALFTGTIVVYLAAAALVLSIPETPAPANVVSSTGMSATRRLFADIKDGLVYILEDPVLLRAIGYLTLASTTFLLVATLGPEFVTSVVGLQKEDIGFVVAPAGAGVLAGVLVVPRVVRRIGRDWLVDLALAMGGVMLVLMALTRAWLDLLLPGDSPVVLVTALTGLFAFILGVCNAFVLVPAQTLLQEHSHEAIRARVYATFFMISNSVAFIPIFFAAAAADLFGVIRVLLVVALLVTGLGILGLMHRRASELARWERVQTGHREGPESLPS
jgi:MFS family permease